MNDNLGLSKIRISFGGSKAFSISQIGHIFSAIENIYCCFSKQIFETEDFMLIIHNVKEELAAFDIIATTKDDKPIKYSSFEEITMCALFSIYSATFENNLEIIDAKTKPIHLNVFELFNIIKPDQQVILTSNIDDKLVKVTILPDNKVLLEKCDTIQANKSYKNKVEVMKSYETNKFESFINSNFEGCILNEVNLSGAVFIDSELATVNFSNSNLNNTNFYNADMSDSNLTNATLTGANLVKVDLSGSNLSNTNLCNANLTNADLSGSNLTNAMIKNANISNTDLSSADLTNTLIAESTIFNDDTDFSNGANWWDAKIENKKLLKWLEKYYPKKQK
ncbi:MAG: pentapeptide repeat-containing protein [Vampirovibrionia bacterium]